MLFPFSPLLLWNSKSYNKSVGTCQTGIFKNSIENTAYKYDFKIELHSNTTLNKKVHILLVDLIWLPLTLFISKTITAKSNHAGNKNSIQLWNIQNFGIWAPFRSIFGRVYLKNSKRYRKSAKILPKTLDTIHSTIKTHQNWMKNKNSFYLSNTWNFGISK